MLWTFGRKFPGPSDTGWALQGVAWSDEPFTLRSTPARTGMTVSEPWRSASPLSDALADVEPGMILAGSGPKQRLLMAPLTSPELRPRVSGDPDFDALAASIGLRRLETLPDALRLDTRGIRRLRALIFVMRETERIVLHAQTATGEDLGIEVFVEDVGGEIGGFNDLPEEWRDPDGPWLEEISPLFASGMPALMTLRSALLLFEVELPERTTTVDMGMVDNSPERPGRWGLLVAEATTEAEFRRHSFDETTQSDKRKVVDGALGADESKRALLKPNAAYTVAVTYAVDTADADPDGDAAPDSEVKGHADLTQTFRFHTDAAPPSRLEPFVLATSPAEGEDAVFHADPIRLVFVSQGVRRLYRAYGAELYASVKAATGKQPRGNAYDPALLEFSLSAAGPLAIPAVATTPFNAMLAEAITEPEAVDGPTVLSCLPFNVVATDPHEQVPIDLELEPLTGYVIDLVIRDSAGHRMFDDSPVPSLRRSFTTSRYATHKAFADDLRQTPIRHAYMADPAALTNLGQGGAAGTVVLVTELEFETALRATGWADLTRPTCPRVTVFWTHSDTVPQPFSVMLEATEPFWRHRRVPEAQTIDGVGSYRLVPRPWLALREESTPSVAARILRSSGGTRALVILKPRTRGRRLQLTLRRTHYTLFEGNADAVDATALDVALDAAPWEDE